MRVSLLRAWVILSAVVLGACAANANREPVGESVRPRQTGASTPIDEADGGASTTTTTGSAARGSIEERARRLTSDAIIVDGHNDIPSVLFATNGDIADKSPWVHTELGRLKEGGATGVFFSIYVEGDLAEKPTTSGGGALRRAIDLIDVTYRQVERHPRDLMLATTAAEIREAKRQRKVAVLMGIEGGHAIENSLGALRVLHRLGCRYMTLTHTNTNEWADSAGFSGPYPVRHHGLTPFGEEVVREMQRLGMLVDISHVSDETFNKVMQIAKTPVIASHSSSRAVADHRRNLSDDMLKALAKNGGVAMVNFWTTFISSEYATAATAWYQRHRSEVDATRAQYKHDPLGARAAFAKLRQADPLPVVPISVIGDHIDHMVKVAGIDHVGIGTDFDGVDNLPEGITGVESFPKVTEELLRRGYKDDDVLKILGGNFLRVFEASEKYAKQQASSPFGGGSLKRIDR